jgi:GNAT superfamily N-acetyltransferase
MLDFLVGTYSIEDFKKYYSTLSDLRDFYVSRTHREPGPFELGPDEEQHVLRNPDHLIIFANKGETVGHCVWHETSTEDMIPGDPREDEDRETLHKLFGGKKTNLVELHELWLRSVYRGRGFGQQFFSFFEAYIEAAGFDGIVYYTDHEAAIALCRKRGYREAFLKSDGWYMFALPFSF